MSERKVLIAVDESDNSERAFYWYAEKLHRPNDLVLLVHATEILPLVPPSPYPFAAMSTYDELFANAAAANERSNNLMEKYVQKCNAENFCFKPIKTTGSAGEIICAVAAEENPAMIVLGSRGQGLISRTLLGSVSDYCVHHSSVPVVVVPPSDRHEKHGTDNYGGHDAVCQKTKEQ